MIITDTMLKESLAALNMESLSTWGEQELKSHYREAARTAHPDAGGTMKDWAAVDKANAVLKEYLRKPGGPAQPKPPERVKCGHCLGNGYTVRKGQRGFKVTTLRVQCVRCKGTGEEGVEHDKGDWG